MVTDETATTRRRMKAFVAAQSLKMLLPLVACMQAPPSVAATPSSTSPHLEMRSRPLTDSELRKLLAGSFIEEVVPYELRYMATPEQFNLDGTYIRYADNLDLEGLYTIENGKVCVIIKGRQRLCRYILIDPSERYWISKSMSPTDFRLISIRPLRR
jgi:hypothetical protein